MKTEEVGIAIKLYSLKEMAEEGSCTLRQALDSSIKKGGSFYVEADKNYSFWAAQEGDVKKYENLVASVYEKQTIFAQTIKVQAQSGFSFIKLQSNDIQSLSSTGRAHTYWFDGGLKDSVGGDGLYEYESVKWNQVISTLRGLQSSVPLPQGVVVKKVISENDKIKLGLKDVFCRFDQYEENKLSDDEGVVCRSVIPKADDALLQYIFDNKDVSRETLPEIYLSIIDLICKQLTEKYSDNADAEKELNEILKEYIAVSGGARKAIVESVYSKYKFHNEKGCLILVKKDCDAIQQSHRALPEDLLRKTNIEIQALRECEIDFYFKSRAEVKISDYYNLIESMLSESYQNIYELDKSNLVKLLSPKDYVFCLETLDNRLITCESINFFDTVDCRSFFDNSAVTHVFRFWNNISRKSSKRIKPGKRNLILFNSSNIPLLRMNAYPSFIVTPEEIKIAEKN